MDTEQYFKENYKILSKILLGPIKGGIAGALLGGCSGIILWFLGGNLVHFFGAHKPLFCEYYQLLFAVSYEIITLHRLYFVDPPLCGNDKKSPFLAIFLFTYV